MTGYTKLFSSIVTSSIWTEDDQTRIVWITLLAIADKHGEVNASIPGLARVAGVPIAACQRALETFLAPDPHSRTKDDDGRRIEEINGGWALLNYAHYRQLASADDRKSKAAIRAKRYRDKQKRNAQSNASVTQRNACVTQESDNAEAEAEAEALEERERGAREELPLPEIPPISRAAFDTLADARGVPTDCADWFWNTHDARNWTDSKGQAIRKVEPLLINALKAWRANQPSHSRSSTNGTAQLILDQRKLDRVEDAIKRIRQSYESHEDMSSQDKARLRELKAERKQLMDALGMKV